MDRHTIDLLKTKQMSTNASDLVWETKPKASEDVQNRINDLNSEYFGDLGRYKTLSDRRKRARERFEAGDGLAPNHAVRMMEMAIISAVTSIRTGTERWEELTRQYLRGEISPEEFAGKTRDGDVKAEKIRHVFDSDIPARATSELRIHGADGTARKTLSGRNTGDTGDTYLRVTKASFVLWLLGYDVVCMDHRIHRALAPIIPVVLMDTEAKVRDITEKRQANRTAYKPTNVDFWHRELKWSPDVYDVLSGALVDYVEKKTDIPADRVTQVCFNVGGGGDRTTHDSLLKILAGE